MQELKNKLAGLGVDTSKMSDDETKAVAKALKIRLEPEVVEYKDARYVKTDNFPVPHSKDPDRTQSARGLFLRVEAVPQAIADLQAILDQE